MVFDIYCIYMRVILGTDHGGFNLKEIAKGWLMSKGLDVLDVGAFELSPEDDFVDYVKAAVKKSESDDRIILFCRNGFGMCIGANRYPGKRCGLAFNSEAVMRGRIDDDINCLSVPADYIDEQKVLDMVDIFLKEKFSGDEKYQRRINKLNDLP